MASKHSIPELDWPAYILGDRKHIPEAQNAVESVLRTELLDVDPMVHCGCMYAPWILYGRAYSVVCDETAHSTS